MNEETPGAAIPDFSDDEEDEEDEINHSDEISTPTEKIPQIGETIKI